MKTSILADLKGTAMKNIVSVKVLKVMPFPLPPIKEQSRIIAKVDQLMALCDELEVKKNKKNENRIVLNDSALDRLLTAQTPDDFSKHWQRIRNNFDLLYENPENVDKLRQSILQLAVQGRLVPQDPSDEPASLLLKKITAKKERLVKEKKIKKIKALPPIKPDEILFELPGGWEWVRFGQIADIASNLVKPDKYEDMPHIAPNHIEKGNGKLLPYRTVKEDKVRSGNHLFYAGQILYSKIRPNLSKVTIIDFDGLCSADMYPINSFINKKFLLKFMLSDTFVSKAVKKDTRVAMPKINQADLNMIPVPIPPIDEQKRIVGKVDEMLTLCDELETKLSQSQSDCDELLSAIVKGIAN